MKKHLKTFRLLAALLVALTASLAPAAPQTVKADLEDTVAGQVLVAVVSLTMVVEVSGEWEPVAGCSGTFISPDGFILTNSHCITLEDPDLSRLPRAWVVALTKLDDEPPVPSFIAEVAADAPELDLAVIKITMDLGGQPVDGESLDLPYLELGDSDTLRTRQSITIFGYPGVGFETITITTGKITGFLPEAGAKRAWIKTDAAISGGNSGGTAVSDDGKLIGVPTATQTECRRTIDSNGDGRIDERDYCRATGNPVNFVRSINLAKPIIEEAKSGLGTSPTPTPRTTATPRPTGRAAISRLVFANGLNDEGEPGSIVTALPTGSRDLVMYFDYTGFAGGTEWQPRLFINNKEVPDQWNVTEWDEETAGNYGRYVIGFVDADLPDGTYKFQIDYAGKSLGNASIKIGGARKNDPALSNIVFTSGEETGYALPVSDEGIMARFDGTNMRRGTDIKSVWYRSDEQGKWSKIEEATTKWNGSASGKGTAELSPDEPLESGLYRLELMLGGKLAATSDLALTGGGGNMEGGFGPIVFAAERDESDNPVDPGTEFPEGTTTLYYFFDYEGMQPGITWGASWIYNGEVVLEDEAKWDGGESGTYSDSISLRSGNPLPAGEYEVKLTMEGQEVQSATATIDGDAPTPNPTPGPDGEGVKITGTIVDAITGRPIPGAVFGVLEEGVTWEAFQGTDEEILGEAKADRNGVFEMTVPVQRGSTYSVGVIAEGYESILEDGVEIQADAPDVLDITIELQPR